MSRKLSKEKWFKIYDKIYEQMNKFDEKPMLFKANLLGIKLRIERYPNSFCFWQKILYLKEGRGIYKITLDNKFKTIKKNTIDIGIRTEYFFNKKFRRYKGDRFCFIEYVYFWERNKKFPSDKDLSRLGLEKKIAEQYKKFAYKIADIKFQ